MVYNYGMDKYYTYIHKKPDGSIFYVGKGIGNRAYSKRRNNYWKRIVAKYGYEIEIVAYWENEKEAFEHEKLLIAKYKKLGCELANLTDGGEGASGYKHTESHKIKMTGNNYGASSWGMTFKGKKHSEESKAKMSYNRMGNTNKLGTKISEEAKEKIRQARLGKPVIARRVLSPEYVLKIRESLGYRNIAKLAREYGVGESTIRRIKNGEAYKDV